MAIKERWVIRGTLTTRSPLHIGDGEVFPIEEKEAGERRKLLYSRDGKRTETVEVASVAKDHDNKPVIPGSALKGAVRSWLQRHEPNARLESLLGFQNDKADSGEGGLLELLEGPMRDRPAAERPGPFWDAQTCTCIACNVAIDRHTRTASDAKLFHTEYVPKGTSFDVEIRGAIDEDDVVVVLEALEAFNDSSNPGRPVRLGAHSANGWGRLEWQPTSILRMDQAWVSARIDNWLANPETMPIGGGAEMPVSDLVARAKAALQLISPATDYLKIDLTIQMDGPFLVNDVSKTGKVKDKETGHFPMRNAKEFPIDPASSFRGALRQQMEKIVRTIAGGDDAAWAPDDATRSTTLTGEKALKQEAEKLCPVSLLMGAPGWESPLEVSDFVAAEKPAELPKQEFLAIDRFTGGGVDGLKFNAQYAYAPTLKGRIEVDRKRLNDAAGGCWPLILLAYGLRDLQEDDIPLGWGAGKGYGAVLEARWDGFEEQNLDEWHDLLIARLAGKQKVAA